MGLKVYKIELSTALVYDNVTDFPNRFIGHVLLAANAKHNYIVEQ